MATATIEIDDDLIPDGYELVRVGRPSVGENYIYGGGLEVRTATEDTRSTLLVVRKKPPREWWVLLNYNGCPVDTFEKIEDAESRMVCFTNPKLIHVREVT